MQMSEVAAVNVPAAGAEFVTAAKMFIANALLTLIAVPATVAAVVVTNAVSTFGFAINLLKVIQQEQVNHCPSIVSSLLLERGEIP